MSTLSRILVLSCILTYAPLSSATVRNRSAAGTGSNIPRISDEKCEDVSRKTGQLFYVNVDGFGYSGAEAINPEYENLIKEFNIGGIIPHPKDEADYQNIEASMERLKTATRYPLFIGIDRNSLLTSSNPKSKGSQEDPVSKAAVEVGFGIYSGMTGNFGTDFPLDCAERVGYLQAFFHRALGFNQALGPTIEKTPNTPFLAQSHEKVAEVVKPLISGMNSLGLRPVLKHYPYTPDSYDLHDRSDDTKLSSAAVADRLKIFKSVAPKSDFVMSTHLYNSNIDPDDMATFSEKWVERLRNDVGFNGLLMTDALFMFRSYPATTKQMARKWNIKENAGVQSDYSIFAARSIMAGHDIVLLEGNAAQSRSIIKDIQRVACLDTPTGNKLNRRILNSYDRIQSYKLKNRDSLQKRVEFPKELIAEAKQFDFVAPCRHFTGLKDAPVYNSIGKVIGRRQIPPVKCPADMWKQARICRDKEGFETFQRKVAEYRIIPVRRFDGDSLRSEDVTRTVK